MKFFALAFFFICLSLNAHAVSQESTDESLSHHNRLIQRQEQSDSFHKKNNNLKKAKQKNDSDDDVSLLDEIKKKLKEKAHKMVSNGQVSASYNNSGNKLVGEKIEIFKLTQTSLFAKNDNLSLIRSGNDIADKKRDEVGGNTAFVGNYSVPIGDYSLSLGYVRSTYFFHAIDAFDGRSFEVSGESISRTTNLSRDLFKNKKYKLSGDMTLAHSDSIFLLDHVKQNLGSRRVATGSVGFSNSFFLDKGFLFLRPSYHKSLNLFNAQKDPQNLSSTSPHLEFHLWKFDANYSRQFDLDKTPLAYNLSFNGQASDKALYGMDQFSVGGLYSVRGFKEGAISGDSGYNLRNELSFGIGKEISSLFESQNSFLLQKIKNFSVTPFYDYGHVRSKGGQQSGRLSGTGLRFDLNDKHYTASLTASWAVSKSQQLRSYHKENAAVFFNITTQFGGH